MPFERTSSSTASPSVSASCPRTRCPTIESSHGVMCRTWQTTRNSHPMDVSQSRKAASSSGAYVERPSADRIEGPR
ncbi:hypothetical protein [Ramlibacter sp. PS4R-6]|uniref:hypothetical protein n=1 Tax=Ramlibacter sp. PS4R-6 TaxID=3133438 RepID=UPI0030986E0A